LNLPAAQVADAALDAEQLRALLAGMMGALGHIS